MDDWNDDDKQFEPKDWAFLGLLFTSLIFAVIAFA